MLNNKKIKEQFLNDINHQLSLGGRNSEFDKILNHKQMKKDSKERKKQIKNSMNIFKNMNLSTVTYEELYFHGKNLILEEVIQNLGLNKLVWVEHRSPDLLTGSGINHDCHWNVIKLVKRYGGKRVTGFLVQEDLGGVIFNSHSVWLTPENKLVDVTNHGCSFGKVPFSITGIDGLNTGMNSCDFMILSLQSSFRSIEDYLDSGSSWSHRDGRTKNLLESLRNSGHKYGVVVDKKEFENEVFEDELFEEWLTVFDNFKKTMGMFTQRETGLSHQHNDLDTRGGFNYEDGRSWNYV
jgi:hypothetical protein